MATLRLSKRVVDKTFPNTKDVYVWDSELKGFGLKVTPKGRKVYIAQYRIGKRTRRITLGVHGVLTPEEARQKAKVNLGKVSAGTDPARQRDIDSSDYSIKSLFQEFDETYVSIRLKPETAKDYRRGFEKYIFPRFRHITIRAFTKQDILRLHHDMRATPYRANRTIAKVSKFLKVQKPRFLHG
jgi:hypothetical protein